MSDQVQLRAKAQEELNAAKAIQASWDETNKKAVAEGKDPEPMPKDQLEKVNGHLSRFEEYKAHLEVSGQLEKGNEFLNEPMGTQVAHLGFRPSSEDEGMPAVDEKSWREIEINVPIVTTAGVISEKRTIRYQVPLAVQKKGYDMAFEAYLRFGTDKLRFDYPEDFKTLTEAVDSGGGHLVTGDMQGSIIKKIATMSVVRPNARVISVSGDSAKWPKITYTADDEFTSGVRLTWTGETPSASTAHRVTDPVFGMYNIPVHTAMASMPLSNDLIEDASFDVIGIGSELFAEAFALGEESAFWNGSGAGLPRGLAVSAGTTTDAADHIVNRTAASTSFDADEIIDVRYDMPAQYERNAKWFFTRATEKEIRKLKDGSSDYLWPVTFGVGQLGAPPDNLLGFPYLRAEFAPEAGDTNAFPIFFGDMNGYLIVDRVGLSIRRLDERYAETNVALLLGRKRVGGQVIEPWRLKAYEVLDST